MNARQQYALLHPIGRADDVDQMRPLLASRRHTTGLMLKSILAVDR